MNTPALRDVAHLVWRQQQPALVTSSLHLPWMPVSIVVRRNMNIVALDMEMYIIVRRDLKRTGRSTRRKASWITRIAEKRIAAAPYLLAVSIMVVIVFLL